MSTATATAEAVAGSPANVVGVVVGAEADAAPGAGGPNDEIKAPAGPHQRVSDGSPVRWVINERYGLGRDDAQFIVYRTVTPKSDKQRRGSRRHRPVAYYPTLEGALMWIVMRQAHFDDEPTIDTSLIDAFQRYCHHLDRIKADIAALAARIEASLS